VSNPTVREIVATFLKDEGYDGLYSDECACEVGDLFNCMDDCARVCEDSGEPCPCRGGDDCITYCRAGYKLTVDDGAPFNEFIVPDKPGPVGHEPKEGESE